MQWSLSFMRVCAVFGEIAVAALAAVLKGGVFGRIAACDAAGLGKIS
jgi:hypothetical protein